VAVTIIMSIMIMDTIRMNAEEEKIAGTGGMIIAPIAMMQKLNLK